MYPPVSDTSQLQQLPPLVLPTGMSSNAGQLRFKGVQQNGLKTLRIKPAVTYALDISSLMDLCDVHSSRN